MAKEVIMPKLGMTMEEGEILKWWRREGEKVKKGEALLEANSGKANMEVEAPASGILLKILHKEGTVPVAQIVGIIGEEGEDISRFLEKKVLKTEVPPLKKTTDTKTFENKIERIRSTPAAKYYAKQNNVMINKINLSNKGFVSLKDVEEYLTRYKIRATPVAKKIAELEGVNLSEVGFNGKKIYKADVKKHLNKQMESEKFKDEFSSIRKVTASKMVKTWQNVPMVTCSVEVDVSKLLMVCKNINNRLSEGESKVNITDVLIKILAMAVNKNPQINVCLDGEVLIHNQAINIGIAVNIDDGLVVPVLKNIDTKDLAQISREKKRLIQKSKEGKLSLEEMSGGSITLSNMGMFGIEIFTPIINEPQSCILGTGKVVKKPVVKEEKIVIRQMMWISLTFDHRILDGVPVSYFLMTIKNMMEEPELLLM